MRTTSLAAALVVLAAAAAAPAQDGAKPKSADPVAPPAPKKERKTSPEAEAAVQKYASLLHFPSSVWKSMQMSAHADVPQFGGEIGCSLSVKETGEVGIEVQMPEASRRQYGDQLAGIQAAARNMVDKQFKPFLVPADVMAKQYDLSARKDKDKTVVDVVRYADKAAWDKASLTFAADGLLEKVVGMPNIDPNDPMSAMDAGAEVEMTFQYKKRGERSTIESAKVVRPVGETTVKLAYFEPQGSAPLPKQIDIDDPIIGQLSILVHDYVLDGKKVAGTERKDEPKPAAPGAGGPPQKPPAPK